MKFSELCFIDYVLFYNMLYQVENLTIILKNQRKNLVCLSLHIGTLLTWKCILNSEKHICSTGRAADSCFQSERFNWKKVKLSEIVKADPISEFKGSSV